MTALLSGVSPMLATPGRLPADDDGWAYEVKWDGVRLLAAVERGRLTLVSRNGNDVTAAYPELRPMTDQLEGRRVVLDGEVAVFDPAGRTDFGLLQSRMHVRSPTSALITSTPVVLLVFDVLHLDEPTLDWSYDERRDALTGLTLDGPAWRTPAQVRGDGPTVVAASRAQGLEGIVAKQRSSLYRPGARSKAWLKIKNIRRTSAVIVGWTPGERGRAGQIGSLLLGVHGDMGFEYAGHVGTGFTQRTLAMLQELLGPLEAKASPLDTPVPRPHARDATWVRPELVAEIDYTEWTRTGSLRHPSFKGLRDDYDPAAVVRE